VSDAAAAATILPAPVPDPAVEVLTPRGTGAVSIILIRRDAAAVLAELTGRADWPVGAARLADLGGEDRGLAVRLDEDSAWLMPHGGPAVTAAVLRVARAAAEDADAAVALAPGGTDRDPRWPEAADAVEAAMLDVMSHAASPLALDLLAAQPARWRAFVAAGDRWTEADAARSRRLDRLLAPPTVVLAGPPNIGKSTLANALAGRTVAITADEPGTTRDAPSVALDLAGLVVTWHDAPGLRATDDPLERAAIERATARLADADLLLAAADAGSQWPPLPRPADRRIALRPDLDPGPRDDADLVVGVHAGTGLRELAEMVRDALVPPADRANPRPWDAGGQLLAAATG
jgi:tRNA modification GTPase